MHFALALVIAVNFWGARGVHVPCHPVPVSGADAMLAKDQWGYPEAMAATSGCRILISSISGAQRHMREVAPYYCGEVVHEVGHLAGLPHTPTGLMTGDVIYWEWLPYDCIHWRTYAKRHHIPIRR